MQKQREWKILKDLKQTFPLCDKGVEELCQSTISIRNTRYRDVILALSKTNYNLIKTFLSEVTNNLVKVHDKTWIMRFSRLYDLLDKKADNNEEEVVIEDGDESDEFEL